jgi:hypothetical protein
MTVSDINKWISGETEVFFDTREMPPSVTADGNLGAERSTVRPSIQKFVRPAITVVVGAFASVVLVSLVISMRHSVEPLPAADVKSQPSEGAAISPKAHEVEDTGWFPTVTPPPTEIIPTPVIPLLNQPITITTLSDAQIARFLSEVGIWYDRHKAAPTPERKPSPPQLASRRHWSRYSIRAQPDRGEATRLMVDELRQRGVAADTASRSGHPE